MIYILIVNDHFLGDIFIPYDTLEEAELNYNRFLKNFSHIDKSKDWTKEQNPNMKYFIKYRGYDSQGSCIYIFSCKLNSNILDKME